MEECRRRIANLPTEVVPIAPCVVAAVPDGSPQLFLGPLDQIGRFFRVNESARRDLRAGDDLAGIPIDDHDHHQDPFLRKGAAIADDDIADCTDGDPVHIHVASFDLVSGFDRISGDFDGTTDHGNVNLVSLIAMLDRHVAVEDDVTGLSVKWNDVARGKQRQHPRQFVGAGVSRYMYLGSLSVDDLGSSFEELIDDPEDGRFIARDWRGGDDDRVAFADFDIAMVAVRHPAQHGHRFALAAGDDEDDFVVGQE